MRLDQAFKKAGFEIVSAQKDAQGGKRLVFDVRVPIQGQIPNRWKLMMEEVLITAEIFERKENVKWQVDISKRFFAKNNIVRYLWRVVMSGDLAACQAVFVSSVLASLRSGNELKEVPLVGNVDLSPDLKNGRVRGAYTRGDEDRASGVVASAMMGGGGVPFRPMSDG